MRNVSISNRVALFLVLFLVLLVGATGSWASDQIARVELAGGQLIVEPSVVHGGGMLVVVGPEGFRREVALDADGAASVDLPSDASGYRYELRLNRPFDAAEAELVRQVEASRNSEDLDRLMTRLSTRPQLVQSGAVGDSPVARENGPDVASVVSSSAAEQGQRDQVINDDLIVEGGVCASTENSCADGEGFDFLEFKAVGSTAGFYIDSTSTDWQIAVGNGGAGSGGLSFKEETNGTYPLAIETAAPTGALYVDSDGEIGVNNTTPETSIHVANTDPRVRLQDTSSGMFDNPSSFDLQAFSGGLLFSAGFYIRDSESGTVPFIVEEGAPSSSIAIEGNGNVGIGVGGPNFLFAQALEPLHVYRTDGTAKALVDNATTVAEKREMLELQNGNGGVQFLFTDQKGTLTDDSDDVDFLFAMLNNGAFTISVPSTAGPELEMRQSGRLLIGPGSTQVFDLLPSGNLTISGSLTQGSSRAIKAVKAEVNAQTVLQQVANLPLSTWVYHTDENQALHMGPMAEDFHATFGLGADAQHIAPADLAAVGLAGVKALQQELAERDSRIEQLEDANAALAARLARIEALLGSTASTHSDE